MSQVPTLSRDAVVDLRSHQPLVLLRHQVQEAEVLDYISQEDGVEVEAVVPSPLATSPPLSSNRASLHNDGLLPPSYVQNLQFGFTLLQLPPQTV